MDNKKVDINELKIETRKDKIIEIVSMDGLLLEHVRPEFKRDRDVVFAALCSNKSSIKFIDDCLYGDKELRLKYFEYCENNGLIKPEELKKDNHYKMSRIICEES